MAYYKKMKRKGRNKQKEKKRYHRTIPLRNAFERVAYDYLKRRYGASNVLYEAEKIPYVLEKTYLPDFKCLDKDGNICYYEVKGRFTQDDRRKMDAVVKQHPDKRFVMVFQKNNKLYKGSKQRYSDWCDKRNIEWIILGDK